MKTKPIVYIDLVGTLVHWADQGIEPNTLESAIFLPETSPIEYNISIKIEASTSQPIKEYGDGDYINTNTNSNHRELKVLSKYKEVLAELRETCQLRLASWTSKVTTLSINHALELGFDKKEILSKDDMPHWDETQTYGMLKSLGECPEAILISNSNLDSKKSIQQRTALGIEKEQQIGLKSLAMKCLDKDYQITKEHRNVPAYSQEII